MPQSSVQQPNKKRALEDSSGLGATTLTRSVSGRGGSVGGGLGGPPPRNYPNRNNMFVSQLQLESLQAELDHERSLRQLDQTRSRQVQQRLEKQVELAVEDALSAKEMLDKVKEESSRLTSQLRQSRNESFQELRQCQIQLEEQKAELEHVQSETTSSSGFWKEKCRHLEERCKAMTAEEQVLLDQNRKLEKDMENLRVKLRDSSHGPLGTPLSKKSAAILEEAPPAVLSELNRLRNTVADLERQQRQHQRKMDDMQRRQKSLIHEREEGRLASQRLTKVQKELATVSQQHEQWAAEHESWQDFSRKLTSMLQEQGMGLPSNIISEVEGPPEVATILRYLEKICAEQAEAVRDRKDYQAQVTSMKASQASLQEKVSESEGREREWTLKLEDLESKLDASKRQSKVLQAELEARKRETDNLRDLVKTLDDLPVVRGSKTSSSIASTDAAVKSLKITLESVQDRLKVAQDDRTRLSEELESAAEVCKEKQEELVRVKSKFEKLRDALHAERAKAEEAQARADEAEALAGKGSFDPEKTRVLHLRDTPVAQALREEVQVLKRQLAEVSKQSGSGVGESSSKLAPDPDKLNLRLKENFKEQIAHFREGVYLMTGYKVDMLPGTDRPTFRVRSVFAEHEEDQLLLKWPKNTEQVTSLDLLHTDFAKELSQTSQSCYDYIAKFNSLPAFLAALQLQLFEKQTVQIM